MLDIKLTQPLAMMLLLLDGSTLSALLLASFAFFSRALSYDGPLEPYDASLLVVVVGCASYVLLRELYQMIAMARLGRERGIASLSISSYFTDGWNVVDILAITSVGASCYLAAFEPAVTGLNRTAAAGPLRLLSSLSTGLLWLKMLSFVKARTRTHTHTHTRPRRRRCRRRPSSSSSPSSTPTILHVASGRCSTRSLRRTCSRCCRSPTTSARSSSSC